MSKYFPKSPDTAYLPYFGFDRLQSVRGKLHAPGSLSSLFQIYFQNPETANHLSVFFLTTGTHSLPHEHTAGR
jgi:hypothetical protein